MSKLWGKAVNVWGWLRYLVIAAILATLGLGSPAQSANLEVHSYKLAGDAMRTRIVVHFDREPELKWFLLRGPHRLVIDLPETSFRLDPRELKPHGLVAGVRYGNLGESQARIIVSSKGPFAVDRVDVVQNQGEPGWRMVADISAASEQAFEAALAVQAQTTGSTQGPSKPDAATTASVRPEKRFTIVVDPGHGGIDGGAESRGGTVEKTITLAFALELRKKLTDTGLYDVYLTREKDEFLRLDERVRIARQHDADLFISIHADTINLKGVRGATVYTVSDKASDAESKALADRENLADALAGIEIKEENHEVADILFDLIRRETHGYSVRFARSLVDELAASGIGMINNPHRSAGFRVLKAPDVPSVLVELGYLSNPEDEQQLRSADWRKKAADSISRAATALATLKVAAGG